MAKVGAFNAAFGLLEYGGFKLAHTPKGFVSSLVTAGWSFAFTLATLEAARRGRESDLGKLVMSYVRTGASVSSVYVRNRARSCQQSLYQLGRTVGNLLD